MIIYSNPYSTSKNIGKAYNDFINALNVPEDTWIVIQDGDILFLTPDWGALIESVSKSPETFGFSLLGCYTNRVGLLSHLHEGYFSENHDIKHHRRIAMDRKNTYGTSIEPIHNIIAGYFMMFQLHTWRFVGGFAEDVITADVDFSQKVINNGGKLGLIKGLYVYHMYRIHREGRTIAQADHKHLINGL